MFDLKSPIEANEIILNRFGKFRVESEIIPLEQAYGRVLADNIMSNENIPGFSRSTMDGYCLKSQNIQGEHTFLKQIGAVEIGKIPNFSVGEKECAYIPTGGQLPEGVNTVVMVELTEERDNNIHILNKTLPGENIIHKGDDVKIGQEVLKKGICLRPQDIGALAALGFSKVPVKSKLKIGIISTGNELVGVGEKAVGSKVRDINSYSLFAACTACGCEAVPYGIVEDSKIKLKKTIERSLSECTITLITGGSSMGKDDITHSIIEEFKNSAILFHGIAIKPGKPTILAEIDGMPLFGLPGHPVSAYFIFRLFVEPLVRSMYGQKDQLPKVVHARMAAHFVNNKEREECLTVTLEADKSGYKAYPIYGKSGMITALTKADGYIRILPEVDGLAEGTEVTVELFS